VTDVCAVIWRFGIIGVRSIRRLSTMISLARGLDTELWGLERGEFSFLWNGVTVKWEVLILARPYFDVNSKSRTAALAEEAKAHSEVHGEKADSVVQEDVIPSETDGKAEERVATKI
jgi:hypothetical protein